MKNRKFNILIIMLILLVLPCANLSGSVMYGSYAVYAADDNDGAGDDAAVGAFGYKTLQKYDDQWPASVSMDIRYEKITDYPVWPHYIVNVDGDRQRVYQTPYKESRGIIDSLHYGERCQVLELIENDNGEHWYVIMTKIDEQLYPGFIQVGRVEKREFKIEEMSKHVEVLAGMGTIGPVVYIENYKNLNGIPPTLASGEYYDPYGYRRGQSAAGYYNKELTGEFRYIPDGALCIVEEVIDVTDIDQNNIMFDSTGQFVPSADGNIINYSPESLQKALNTYNENAEPFVSKVYVPSFGISLWIESVFIDLDNVMQGGFGQAVVVDRANQNIGVFEYNNGWKLISLSYATTGKSSETAVPTPLGYFMAIEKKDLFEYQEDNQYRNAGFAPYAIRFSGGGYLHGVPMKYEYGEDGKRKPVYVYDESILSIGTVPESHMCIRNFTSHAQFIHEWATVGSCSVIVFE